VWIALHSGEIVISCLLLIFLFTLICYPYPKTWTTLVNFTGAAIIFSVGQSLFWVMGDYRTNCLGVPWVAASWIEFCFYATSFVLQVYLLGYWFSVTSLVNPVQSSRFQIVRFVLSWLVTLSVVFDGVIRALFTKLSGEVEDLPQMNEDQQNRHTLLINVQYCAYSVFAIGMTGAAWLDVTRINKILATLPPEPSPLTNTMNLARRQLLFTGWMDLLFSLLTWAQLFYDFLAPSTTEIWGYLMVASVALRHFAILSFLGMNIWNLRSSLKRKYEQVFAVPSHLQESGAFALISDEPSADNQTSRSSSRPQAHSTTPSKTKSESRQLETW